MLDIEPENWDQIIVERLLGTLDLTAVSSEYQFVVATIQLIADWSQTVEAMLKQMLLEHSKQKGTKHSIGVDSSDN